MGAQLTDRGELEGLTASPLVAVALLHSLRATDTPRETLDDEDLRQSLPRRLGLSDAVADQLRRYRELLDRNRSLPATELADLFTLVGRRPDARAVFEGAGRWLAASHLERRVVPRFLLPGPLRRRLALRTARTIGTSVSPGARIRTETDPPTLVVRGSLPALATGTSDGCEIFLAALRAALHTYLGEPPEVDHPHCEAHGDARCVWSVVT